VESAGSQSQSDHHRPHGDDQVYGITTAETSHTDDISRRQKQYILTMLVRVVSIVVVVCVPGISWPVKIGLCLVATIIPYVAVVRANGGPSPDKDPTNLLIGPPQRGALGSAQPGLPGPGGAGYDTAGEYAAGEYVSGERVFDDASDIGHTNESRASQGSMNEGGDHRRAPGAAAQPDQSFDQASDPF
jgi:hypothetical protein